MRGESTAKSSAMNLVPHDGAAYPGSSLARRVERVTGEVAAAPTVTVIICTRHRPQELAACLSSLLRTSFPVAEVIVSDDGTQHDSREVALRFGATWTAGPKRGLGPNRNHALTLAKSTHVLFLDDDATLGRGFLANCVRRLEVSRLPVTATIVTGVEVRADGHWAIPHDQDFLGYQRRRYRADETMKTVVINSALFPRGLFSTVHFDEQLVYGYDEVDLTSRAVRAGYSIISAPDAVNHHNPSPINREYYRPRQEAARLYVTAKRRLVTERSPGRAAVFLAVAIPHLAANAVAGRTQVPARQVGRVSVEALMMLRRHLQQSRG